MRYFMGNYSGQLFLVFHGLKQPAVNKNMARRGGESIVNIILYYIKMIDKRLRGKDRDDFIANVIYIVDNERIFYNLIMI